MAADAETTKLIARQAQTSANQTAISLATIEAQEQQTKNNFLVSLSEIIAKTTKGCSDALKNNA